MKQMLIIIFMFLTSSFLFGQTAVAPGDGTLGAAIKAAAANDVLVLESGGVYTELVDSVFVIDKLITIKAADGYTERPKIMNHRAAANSGMSRSDLFMMDNGGGLVLIGLDFDGGAADTSAYRSMDDAFDIQEVASSVIIKVEMLDCHMHHFDGNLISGRTNTGADVTMSSFRAENCEFNQVQRIATRGGSFQIDDVFIENCTFWDFVEDAMYIENGDSSLVINHCTFDNIGATGLTDMVRIRQATWDTVLVTNCIFSNGDPANDALQIDSNPAGFVTNIAVFNAGSVRTGNVVVENQSTDDPKYTDGANGDFTLLGDSPYLNSATDGHALGDLRWDPAATAIQRIDAVPGGYKLMQNYPNPFNPVTSIDFSIARQTSLQLRVYDITGALVTTLVNSTFAGGTYSVIWDASDLSSGIYYYQLTTNDFSETKKMTLMK